MLVYLFSIIIQVINVFVFSGRIQQNGHGTIDNGVPIFDIRYDESKALQGTSIKDCHEAISYENRGGIYNIHINNYFTDTFLAECDAKTQGGDWLIIQRRHDGSVDFFRNWNDYVNGFGNIGGEFFIGLEKLYALTNFIGPQELLIVLKHKNDIRYAKYSDFVIGHINESYALKHLGVYSGNTKDNLRFHLGRKFSTKDRDNDDSPKEHCAKLYKGGWWYKNCHQSNLNGIYGETKQGQGINWKSFKGFNISLQYVKMMIRRRRSTVYY